MGTWVARRKRWFWGTVAVALLVAAGAGAQDGLYIGVAVGRDQADVTYTKTIGLDVPPPSEAAASDGVPGGFPAFKGTLGYRAPLVGWLFIAGEVETAVHGGDGVAGTLQEGTGLGDRDVWPGGWAFEKGRSIGLNAKLGMAPVGLLGDGGAAYVIFGRHRLGAAMRLGFENAEMSGVTPWSRALHSWVRGFGVECGSVANRLSLEVRNVSSRAEWMDPDAGDGSALGSPRVGHAFETTEWGIFIGFVRSF
ncbi:MAG: hypothetical protein F4X79_12260 [Acidobacteria bacterium]|nr:hypothetical protein [Gammaproteobacteria bacterium]MYE44785.1 hypothetical protein [Acidobacteriota bacterium]